MKDRSLSGFTPKLSLMQAQLELLKLTEKVSFCERKAMRMGLTYMGISN